MRTKIRKLFQRSVLGYEVDTYVFAQCGEDAMLRAIFHEKIRNGEPGFFVDVGAFHPYQHSNTYAFYLGGWSGINIDARPGSMKAFRKLRPRDINLEIGIGREAGEKTYYFIGNDSGMNSFSRENLMNNGMLGQVKEEIVVPVRPLSQILEQHRSSFGHIDFLSVDAEGFDFDVIASNDWEQFRPSVVVVELQCTNVFDVQETEVSRFLCALGYEIVAKNVILRNIASVVFVHRDFHF